MRPVAGTAERPAGVALASQTIAAAASRNAAPPLDLRHLVIDLAPGHPTQANGVHNVARALIREQRATGDAARLMMIATTAPPGPEPDVPTQLVLARGLRLAGRLVWLEAGARAALFEGIVPATVFHLHASRDPLLPGLALALRRRGLPYAVTVHGRYSHAYDESGRPLKRSTVSYLEWLERPVLEAARFVQALSPEEARVIAQVAPRARIELVGNGAYSSALGAVPPPITPRGPSSEFPHFGYCGRYAIAHKGLDLLLEGFARYRRAGGRGRLTTIGSGTERETLQRMAEALGLTDAVTIHGPMFGAERDAALRGCDFFIMTSRFEGVPLAALEAAMLGLPLVVSGGTGLRAPVEARGAGVPIMTPTADGVAEGLHRAAALTPAAWLVAAEAAHAMALDLGDWSRIAAKLRGFYHP